MSDESLTGVPVSEDGMDPEEANMASTIYAAMMRSMHESDRSQQAQEFRVGVSDLGYCSERLRRFLDRQVPDEIDMLPAFHGTWLGEGIERAIKAAYPKATIQAEVTLNLTGQTTQYSIPGHVDVLFPDEGVLLDVKSAFGLDVAARTGMEDQGKKFQRHGYGYAAWESGMFSDDVAFEDVRVGNIWVDRSAKERRLLVKTERLSRDVIENATSWLDDVVYAWQNGEEAMKEPAREVCATTCGFYVRCRLYDTDVSGLIEDPKHRAAAQLAREATQLRSKANKMSDEAKAILAGVSGATPEKLMIRWTHVPATKIEEHERRGYDKLEVKEMK